MNDQTIDLLWLRKSPTNSMRQPDKSTLGTRRILVLEMSQRCSQIIIKANTGQMSGPSFQDSGTKKGIATSTLSTAHL